MDSKQVTVQEYLQSLNTALDQNKKWLTAKEKEVKTAQSSVKKYKGQIKTITAEKELTLRTHHLCFTCHKQLSSDEVKFCIDKQLQPLCQSCQRQAPATKLKTNTAGGQ